MADKTIYYARDLLEKGQDFVIAKVVDSKGSTARKKGAWMLLRQDGTTSGTVGGGVLEAETEKLCLQTLQTKEKDRIYHFRLNGEEQHALDMRCGGDVHVQIQYIDAEHPEDFVQDFSDIEEADVIDEADVKMNQEIDKTREELDDLLSSWKQGGE